MKNILQLSSLFVLLTTSVIAEVIPTADEVKAVLIKVEYGKDLQIREPLRIGRRFVRICCPPE